jgi:glycerophosphoryl diester phosphodiesterase
MLIISHRGARGLAPENTVAGLTKALECNADMVEFDLRVTKDGTVILHHNPKIIDASGNKLKISDRSYEELKNHKPDLATFKEALDKIGPGFPKYVEVKPKVSITPIVAIVEKYLKEGWSSENFLLASFSQKTLLEIHEKLPDIQKIVIEKWSSVRARYRARQIKTKMVAMNKLWLWSGFIIAMRHAGYELYAYTLNNPKKAKRWEKYGLAGVVTDYPDRFKHRS